MRRLKEYARFLTWNFGLSYIALWILAFWTFDYGKSVFSQSGACWPDPTTALFYWVCERAAPISILATLANMALTLTVWGPVYIAAATVNWDAIAIAVPILGLHLIGLATAILIATRMTLALFEVLRRILSKNADTTPGPALPAPDMQREAAPPSSASQMPAVKPRHIFGLRGAEKS